jgi:hypothetical protein
MRLKVITIAILFAIIPTTILSNNLPQGIIFRIKVESDKAGINSSKICDFEPINISKEKNLFVYEIGAFSDFIRAQKAKNVIREMGNDRLEIIVYYNNKLISMDDAFLLMDNRNESDRKGEISLSDKQIDLILSKIENPNFYYTVQIGIFKNPKNSSFFNCPITIEEHITDVGEYRYTCGKYFTFKEAKAVCKAIRLHGLSNAFISAYNKENRIPMEQAIIMEDILLQDGIAAK